MNSRLVLLLFIIIGLAAAVTNDVSNSTLTSTPPSMTTTPSFSPSPTYLATNGTGAPSITGNSRVPELPSYTTRPSAVTSGTTPPQTSPAMLPTSVSDAPTTLCSTPDCGNSSFSPSSTIAIVQTPAPTETDSIFSPPSVAPTDTTDGENNQIQNNYGASCDVMLANHPECKAVFNVCSGSFNSCAAEGFVDGCAVQNCQAHGSSAAGETAKPNGKENGATKDASSHYDPVTSRATMVPVGCLCYLVALFFGMRL